MDRQITPALLPYAVAAMEVARPSKTQPESIRQILDNLYHDPEKLQARLREMPLVDAWDIGRKHDMIREMATKYATRAWSLLAGERLTASPAEEFGFYRAFYRFDILCSLIRHEQASPSNAEDAIDAKLDFLSRHPPWENEQIGCVHDLLEDELSTGTWTLVGPVHTI